MKMNDINDILDYAKSRMQGDDVSDRSLALEMNFKAALTPIRKKHIFLHLRHCIKLAKMVDMEPLAVYAISEASRDSTPEVHKFWESTAKMAMHGACAALLLSGLVSGTGDFGLLNDSIQLATFAPHAMDIM